MRYLVLATDYDGTLAHDGVTDADTVAAIERFRAAGGRPILVTGRELPDLQRTFDRLDLFERVVAENGGLLYDPATRRERMLGPASDPRLVDLMRARAVTPLSVGKTIIATVEPWEQVALEGIRSLGLELQVIFNKGAVMVLPSGVNKATGLCAALDELCLSPHNVVGIGDAENDHALLDRCELSVAVANAIPTLKARADLVTTGARGAGVTELIDRILSDPRDPQLSPARHRFALGRVLAAEPQAAASESEAESESRVHVATAPAGGRSDSRPDVLIEPVGHRLLISGPSGAGKSTLTNTLLEQLAARRYQFCLIDPEGDYETFERGIRIGTTRAVPAIDEVVGALKRPDQNVIVSLTGVGKADRPAFFATLLPRVQALRAEFGRPHWLVIDEAHHVLPADWQHAGNLIPQAWSSLAMVTLEPDLVSPIARRDVDLLIAVGQVLPQLASLLAERGVRADTTSLDTGVARMWPVTGGDVVTFEVRTPDEQHRRHKRKYVEGALSPETQFVFSGRDGRLRLTARNLSEFLRLAEGVDDETWVFHLASGDYSRWFQSVIKDEELAAIAADLEAHAGQSRATALDTLKAAITERYSV